MKVLLGTIGAVLLVVAAAAAAVYFGVVPSMTTSTPEYSARYYPPDVLAYGWMTLNPGGGQRQHMRDLWDRSNELSAFRDAMDDVLDPFEDELGIDFEEDVATWIGPDMAVAVFDIGLNNNSVEAAATIGIRDSDSAAGFLEDWMDYMEDESAADFEESSAGDFDTWVDENVSQAYALSDDLLVFATTEDTLDDLLTRIAGDGRRTLADTDDFQEARAALPDRRFASLYVNLEEAYGSIVDLAPELLGSLNMADGVCEGLIFETPRWMASSAGWVDRGVILEWVSPTSGEGWPESPDLADASGLLPDDTMGFLSISFDPVLDHWRQTLSRCNLADMVPGYGPILDELGRSSEAESLVPGILDLDEDSTLANALDLGLRTIEGMIGIDLEIDLLDHLGGQFIVSVNDVDFDAVAQQPEANPIEVVALLSYREGSQGDLTDTLDSLAGQVETAIGLDSDSVDVGAAARARVFPIGDTLYSPGYVLHDGYVVMGTTRDALEAIVARQKGGGALSSDAEYQRTVSHLPAGRKMLVYVNLRRVIDGIGRDEVGLSREQYRVLESLGAAAISFGATGSYSRMTLALTLFPGE